MQDCLFCKIARNEIPAQSLYSDEHIVAFADINPQAPTHVLFIPRQHFDDATKASAELLGHLLKQAAAFGEEHLLDGFRTVINTGDDGGQTVKHVHLHVLGGRPLGWPPG